jgi:hypothetical protein
MTFTIPEFWVGVILTIAVGFAILLTYGIVYGIVKKRKDK